MSSITLGIDDASGGWVYFTTVFLFSENRPFFEKSQGP